MQFFLSTGAVYLILRFLMGFLSSPKIRRLYAIRITRTTRTKMWVWTDNRGYGDSVHKTRTGAILSAIRGD